MPYVIVNAAGRVIWRGQQRSTCLRLAGPLGGTAGIESFGQIHPINA